MYVFVFMCACMNLCISEQVLYYVAQVHYVSEKTLLSITLFNDREHPYFSPSLRKSGYRELRNRSQGNNMLYVLLEFL